MTAISSLRGAKKVRHCEERSDEAIYMDCHALRARNDEVWIALLPTIKVN